MSVRILRQVGQRLLGLVFVLAAVVTSVFLMMQLVPGDPLVSETGGVTQEQLDRLRALYGLDQSVFDQFTAYVGNLFQGDLGRSFRTQEPVVDIIQQRIWSSLELAGAALLIVMFVGFPLAMFAAAATREGRHRRLEVGFLSVTSVLGATPNYLIATLLAFVFAVQFTLLPVGGSGSFEQLILPALAVAIAPTMSLARIVRLETLDVLSQDYVRTARSQRLPTHMIYLRHVFPNVLTAALTVGGLIFAEVIGGAVIVENVFARPGLGTALVDGVLSNNYPVVQGATLVLAVTVVVVNTAVDITLDVLDPRARTG